MQLKFEIKPNLIVFDSLLNLTIGTGIDNIMKSLKLLTC